MAHDRAGERVLRIGVYVHLDHAVAQGLFDLFFLGAGTTVEHEVERQGVVTQAQLLAGNLLAV